MNNDLSIHQQVLALHDALITDHVRGITESAGVIDSEKSQVHKYILKNISTVVKLAQRTKKEDKECQITI